METGESKSIPTKDACAIGRQSPLHRPSSYYGNHGASAFLMKDHGMSGDE